MKRISVAAIALAAMIAAPRAHAQFKVGIAGGASVPTGELADLTGTGYHGQLMLGIAPPLLPVAFRADLSYGRFGVNDEKFVSSCEALGMSCGMSGNVNVMSATANAIISMPSVGIRPYLIAGGGVYRQQAKGTMTMEGVSQDMDDSETRPGVTGGVGLSFGMMGKSVFAEARYVNIFGKKDDTGEKVDTRYVPISIGFMF
ncbi:MAG TPA: outer membrane beta-barrel protein [Gemmatimonadaceae bacterium]|nr:outer membrane beta-barrel protein [Gemmatimonadaceae bacterium]